MRLCQIYKVLLELVTLLIKAELRLSHLALGACFHFTPVESLEKRVLKLVKLACS